MSKVFSHTDSFIAEEILPNTTGKASSVWQEMPPQRQFISENGLVKNPPSDPAAPHEEKNTPTPEPAPQPEAEQPTPPSPEEPAIDVELIRHLAYTEGVEEGRRQCYEDFFSCGNTFRQACDQLATVHETILRNNIEEMHELIMIIAEKIIRHSLADQNKTVLATIEEAIRLAVKSDEFHIRINPAELETITEKRQDIINSISGLDNITLKGDRAVERGGCIVESANCTVDATIGSQMQVIREALHNHATLLPPSPDSEEE